MYNLTSKDQNKAKKKKIIVIICYFIFHFNKIYF